MFSLRPLFFEEQRHCGLNQHVSVSVLDSIMREKILHRISWMRYFFQGLVHTLGIINHHSSIISPFICRYLMIFDAWNVVWTILKLQSIFWCHPSIKPGCLSCSHCSSHICKLSCYITSDDILNIILRIKLQNSNLNQFDRCFLMLWSLIKNYIYFFKIYNNSRTDHFKEPFCHFYDVRISPPGR